MLLLLVADRDKYLLERHVLERVCLDAESLWLAVYRREDLLEARGEVVWQFVDNLTRLVYGLCHRCQGTLGRVLSPAAGIVLLCFTTTVAIHTQIVILEVFQQLPLLLERVNLEVKVVAERALEERSSAADLQLAS